MKRSQYRIALVVILAATAPAAAEVTYHEFAGDVYGSDGTRIHRFGGDTYITDKHGHETKCHTFAGRTTCR